MTKHRSRRPKQRPIKKLDLVAFVASIVLAAAVYTLAGAVAMSTVIGAAAALYILWRALEEREESAAAGVGGAGRA